MIEFVEYEDAAFRKVIKTDKYWVHTDIGNLIDTMCGNSAYIWGYNHHELNQSLIQQLGQVNFLRGRNNEKNDLVDQVNHKFLHDAGMSGIIWACSGSDGVEAGLELAHQFWTKKNNKKNKIISFVPGYHGCTYLGKSLWGGRSNSKVILLDAPSWTKIDDRELSESQVLEQIEKLLKLDKSIGTIIFETVPWISGIRPYGQLWWQKLRNLCDQYDILMVADDVWGGFGKVETTFSHKLFDTIPDIVIMGKSITGGYVPLSCALCNQRVSHIVDNNNWIHGHTWQPQMLGIALADKCFELFDVAQVRQINKKQLQLADKLNLQSRGSGLTKELLLDKPVSKKNMELAGLCNTQYTNNSLFLITPLCADEEYWYEIEKRITKLL